MHRNPWKDERGETMVEVVVSFVLLLLFIGMFNAAIGFSRGMMDRANRLRDSSYAAETQARTPGEADPAAPAAEPDAMQEVTLQFELDGRSFSMQVRRYALPAGEYTYHKYAVKEDAPS